MKITNIIGRYILDSRGYPTVEADVYLEDGSVGRAAVPSGASTGSREAIELRDNDKPYGGKGVEKAVANINDLIRLSLVGYQSWDQLLVDKTLIEIDGTPTKGKLGANAILAVSLAVAKAHALSEHIPLFEQIARIAGRHKYSLPMPMVNILNGGKHAAGSTDVQEFMIIPSGAQSFSEAMRMSSEVFHALGKVLSIKGFSTLVGDEGGYAPNVEGGTEEAIELIQSAVERAGYQWGEDIVLALDVAASELVDNGSYNFSRAHQTFSTEELVDFYAAIAASQPLVSLEDGLGENDWNGWKLLTRQLGHRLQLVGDDLLVTNTKILKHAITEQAANAILIKPNQIGTLSETIDAVKTAQEAGWQTIISHRSGETEDTTIAHLAVGLNAGQIKTGSMSRSERLAKYNELVRISELLPESKLYNPFSRN